MLWGCEQQLTGWRTVVDLAIHRLPLRSDNSLELELSTLGKDETARIGELLRALAQTMTDADLTTAREKWVYLLLSSLYRRRDEIADPLAEVESIYADFDYPETLMSFVRYMPPSDGYKPDQHTADENKMRLFKNWKRYLETTATQFGVSFRE
jgi:hypothetical protein